MKAFLCLLLLVATLQSSAQTSEIFAPDSIAVRGYDVVAFFTDSHAVKGSASFKYKWKNAEWWFATQRNLDLFKANPAMYEPQYGGWCAYGLSRGYKASTIAETWHIENGKLYFNYNQKVKAAWQKDKERFIDSANRKWPQVRYN